MKKALLHTNHLGFSLVETLVAMSVFLVSAVATIGITGNITKNTRHAANRERATILAEEALEVARNLRDANPNFADLPDGTYGISSAGNQWTLSGTSDTQNIFTRSVTISTINENQKKVDSSVSWTDQASAQNSVTVSAYLTNWHAVLNTGDGLTVNKIVINHGGNKTADNFAPYMVGTTTITIGEPQKFPDGTYTVTETQHPDYIQTFSGDCDANGQVNMIANTNTTCIITNEEKPSQLTVNKVVINHGSTKTVNDFTLLVDSNPVTSGVVNVFNSGLHTVSETPDASYNTTMDGDCNINGNVTLSPGTSKTCTVTNEEKLAYVFIHKNVINYSLSKIVSDFAPFRLGVTTVPVDTTTTLNSGNYTVSETADANYTTTFSGDCDSSGNITLVGGSTKSCTITNEEKEQALGMIAYGNGGTTLDSIRYSLFTSRGTWTTASATADIDAATTNRALREMQLYSSPTRNEKILISRHYNGTTQYIYGQVYNGDDDLWGNVQLLSSWNATTYLDVRNFDGVYTANGNFYVVYSDNTTIPKMRNWNGSAWSGQTSLTTLGTSQIPSFIRIAARPGTNEMMAAFFTQALDTITEYWSGSAWSAITSHSTNAYNANNQEVDFAWNPNTPTAGALIYITGATDKTPRGKIFIANGTGGGTWGSQYNGTAMTQNIRNLEISANPKANSFVSCYKNQLTVPGINCRRLAFSGNVITWTTPTNASVAAASTNNTNQSFDLDFEYSTAGQAVMVYSDNSAVPKLKKYSVSGNSFDTAVTTINTSPSTLTSPVQSTIVMPYYGSDDMMFVIADAAMHLYSVMWNGTSDTVYTTPAGKAFYSHGGSGASAAADWYDFVWN